VIAAHDPALVGERLEQGESRNLARVRHGPKLSACVEHIVAKSPSIASPALIGVAFVLPWWPIL
jgi:hypothetical protein